MDPKQLHDFLFSLYDYADYLADTISSQNDTDYNNSYYMSLLYIEDMMDKEGRMLIRRAADQITGDGHDSLSEAHHRLDLLRKRISDLRKEYSFIESASGRDIVEVRTESLVRDWSNKSS